MKLFGNQRNSEPNSRQALKSKSRKQIQLQTKQKQNIQQHHIDNLTSLDIIIPTKSNINESCMRQRLFTWANSASVLLLQLKLKTVQHALRLFDMIVMKKNRFFRNNTQSKLFLVSSLFISSKYQEIYPPCASDFAFICKDFFTVEDILKTQCQILSLIQFNLNFPLLSDWYGTLYNQNMPQWAYSCYAQLPACIDQRELALIVKQVQQQIMKDKNCKIDEVVKRYNKNKSSTTITKPRNQQKTLIAKSWLKKL